MNLLLRKRVSLVRPLGPEGDINTRLQAPRIRGGYKYEVTGPSDRRGI